MEKFNIEDVISNKSILGLDIINIELSMTNAYSENRLNIEEDIKGHKKIREINKKLGKPTYSYLKLLTIANFSSRLFFPFKLLHVGTIVEVKMDNGKDMVAVVCFYEFIKASHSNNDIEARYKLILINDDGIPLLKDDRFYYRRQLTPISDDIEYGYNLIAYYEYCHM